MRKLLFYIILSATFIGTGLAQQNMTLLSHFPYQEDANDIWGYVAPDGTEYALVGLRNGVSIVNLSDPSNPTESDYISGPSSTWRDLKTWGNYAYITNETSDGILIIDLTNLPGAVASAYYLPTIDGTPLESAHNIYIDEFGYAYVCGAGPNDGGAIIFDLNVDAWNPPQIANAVNIYAHDIYVRDNILYTSDVYAGVFSIYDVSDKNNITFLGSNGTPFAFTHNAWISDDSNTIFTTDERGDAPVAAYDISDPSDIKYLSEVRPPATIGKGVIPHNTHVLNDYLVTSYYTDGVVIFDGNRPSNLVQVGQYDTYSGGDGGFNGCWGAYPFLPSGIVLASDINTGLYVLGANYVRACYLEGDITDSSNGNPINDASIEVVNAVATASAVDGTYATGYPTAGTYQVVVSKPGYASKTETVVLTNGQLTMLDVALNPLTAFTFKGLVRYAVSGNPAQDALVNIRNNDYDYNAVTDANGEFSLNGFYEATYQVYAGKWGFKTTELSNTSILNNGNTIVIDIEEGIEDVFELDFGWTVTGDAQRGIWEREIPIGTSYNGNVSNPEDDITTDVGIACYVTGNGGGGPGDDDVDNGTTILTSPEFDLTGMASPEIAYYAWFFNDGGNGAPNDQMVVRLTNGTTTVDLETIISSGSNWRPESIFDVDALLTPTATMQLIVEVSDLNGGHITEGAIDNFRAYDGSSTANSEIKEELFDLEVAPNPSSNEFIVSYNLLGNLEENSHLVMSNLLGQIVEKVDIQSKSNQIRIGNSLGAGIYFIQIITPDGRSQPYKIVKTE